MDINMYSPKVTRWHLINDILQYERTHDLLAFSVGLTPPDPSDKKYSYFTIFPDFRIVNSISGKILIQYELETTYRIENNQEKPSPEFLFEIVKLNVIVANDILSGKTGNTVVPHIRIPVPTYNHLYPDLIQAILLACR